MKSFKLINHRFIKFKGFYLINPKQFITKHTYKEDKKKNNDSILDKNDKFYKEDDLIFDIIEPQKFKGSLLICPTPIGNLNDLSIRQYEALKVADIIACEDTRVTGKLLQLITKKKMKESFYNEFGITVEEFVNMGGMSMNDEDISNKIFNNTSKNKKTSDYYEFYKTSEDINKESDIMDKLEKLVNKSEKDMLNNKKTNSFKDQNDEVFDNISSKAEFERKKEKLEIDEENLEYIAENYHKSKKLSYILKAKVKLILDDGSSKKRKNHVKDEIKDENNDSIGDNLDFLDLGYQDEYFENLKKRIAEEKMSKGRGLLFSYRKEKEDTAIPKLIKAMKLGLKIALVSDAGTPTISDSGYKLVKAVSKEGIKVEPIPGPSALITAISASGINPNNFMFLGFLSKIQIDKTNSLKKLKECEIAGVFYESPNRILETLELLKTIYDSNHIIYIGNELTKSHESHFYGTIASIIEEIKKLNKSEKDYLRGELSIVVSPFKKEIVSQNSVIDSNMNISILKTAEKLNEMLDITPSELKKLLMNIFDINGIRAEKISYFVKYEKKALENLKNVNLGKEDKFVKKYKEKLGEKI